MAEKLVKCPVCKTTVFSDFLEVTDHFLSKEKFSIQACDACGFRFVNPRPEKTEIGRYYQSEDYISHDAKKGDLISRVYRLARVVSISRKFGIVKANVAAGNILDIGCGTGEFLGYCRSKGFEISGFEPNEKAREYAMRENNIPMAGNLADLKDKHSAYSCITMWHVLEHVHDLDETLAMIRGMLKPDGVFIVAVPNSNSWDAQNYGSFWAAYDVPRHLYHFTGATLTKLISRHGFEMRKVLPQKLDAFYVSMLSEKYRHRKNNYLKSLFLGFWSNFQAWKKGRGHSSQIFVLTLKNT